MILGNKCDMEDKRQVSKDRGEAVSILGSGREWVSGQIIELEHNKTSKNHKTNKMACAPREDSDQSGRPPSLISLCCLNEESLSP